MAMLIFTLHVLSKYVDQREYAEYYENAPRSNEIGLHTLLDVVEIHIGQRNTQNRSTDEDQNDGLHIASHVNNAHPTMTLTRTATTKVADENRQANLRPKNPVWSEMSLISTMGPTTRKANRAVSEN